MYLLKKYFVKKTDSAILKVDVVKLDINKLTNVPSNSKSKVDKLDVDKLVAVSVDLSKLIVVVKNDVIKKDVYDAKFKNIEAKITDITKVATNTTFNSKINETKNEIPSITNLATTAAFNGKINGFKGKIFNITSLATPATLTVVECKIPNVGKLVKKNCL